MDQSVYDISINCIKEFRWWFDWNVGNQHGLLVNHVHIGWVKVDFKYIIPYQEEIIFHIPKFHTNSHWLSNGYVPIVQAMWKIIVINDGHTSIA